MGSDEFIDANNPAQIPNITEDDNIIFKAVFLGDFGIGFININFIIEFVTHFDKMVCT